MGMPVIAADGGVGIGIPVIATVIEGGVGIGMPVIAADGGVGIGIPVIATVIAGGVGIGMPVMAADGGVGIGIPVIATVIAGGVGIGMPVIAADGGVGIGIPVMEVEGTVFTAAKARAPENVNKTVTKEVERKNFDIGNILLGIFGAPRRD